MQSISYASSSDDEVPIKKQKIVQAAPFTELAGDEYAVSSEISYNMPYDLLTKPIAGPINPFATTKQVTRKNMLSGYLEEHSMDSKVFDEMRNIYEQGVQVEPDSAHDSRIKIQKTLKKRVKKSDASSLDYLGPWAGYEGEEPEQENAADYIPEPAMSFDITSKKDLSAHEKTTFHGSDERDYLGRNWMHPPSNLDINLLGGGAENCFIPKRLIHTWTGHTKGVNCIRFFPKTAHLILSASIDTKIKIWDCYRERQCIRTYQGHTKAVRDVAFMADGQKFMSVGFDRYIKEWDTETGQCLNRFSLKKLPFCVTYHPQKSNIFLVGCEDRKIYQFDSRTGEIVQEYSQHAGGVRSITFIDDGRRFVSTSDDKTLRAWEFDIPVVIKYASDSELASMPSVTLSHDRQWLICQTLNNEVVTFSASDKFKLNRKKTFRGHLVAGYACQPGISPDGRFVMSGDSQGMMWFWDWKTCKVYRKFKAHDGVIMGAIWHPHEASKVATCSWDGTIKYWD